MESKLKEKEEKYFDIQDLTFKIQNSLKKNGK